MDKSGTEVSYVTKQTDSVHTLPASLYGMVPVKCHGVLSLLTTPLQSQQSHFVSRRANDAREHVAWVYQEWASEFWIRPRSMLITTIAPKEKSWFEAFTNFLGVNTTTVAEFKLHMATWLNMDLGNYDNNQFWLVGTNKLQHILDRPCLSLQAFL